MKNILFIIDKIEFKYFEFNKLVTDFWLIKEFLNRNFSVKITTTNNLYLSGNVAYGLCYDTFAENEDIFHKNVSESIELDSFDIIMFRPDPPVNIDYINATYVLDFVKKAEIINSPRAVRNFNEKLHSLYFSEYMPESIVTSSLELIENFLKEYKQIVLKPLNRCFGASVMYLYEGDPNTRTIINTLTNEGNTIIMVQKYLPAVKGGDSRVLTLGDRILPYSIKKLPGKDDFKFNTHSDSYIIRSDLNPDDLNLFVPVAKKLNNMGIKMAGLDVIEDKIIEVNVTSPCYFIKEINAIYNINLEKEVTDYLLTSSLLSV